ncbi:MAG: hypothetical protein ACREH4_15075, partial [Vitreimonas sp.]
NAATPPRFYASFRAAVELYHTIDREGGTQDCIVLRTRMLERALTSFKSVPRDDLNYLLKKLDAS